MSGGTKINQLLQDMPSGTILLSSYMADMGYPYELQQKYRSSGWLTSIGKGAMIRTGDKLRLEGAVYSLQKYAGMPIHIGAGHLWAYCGNFQSNQGIYGVS